jgi:predicted nucleotidyltransferase component of viral defense system
MLYWNTVSPLLKDTLSELMQAEVLHLHRLVGGTALSLLIGHRMSIDIDLFTDAPYRSIDYDAIEDYLKSKFDYLDGDFGVEPVNGKSYLIGKDKKNAVKLDIFYVNDPFFQDAIEEDGVRLATIEEIIAMKVDVVQRIGRKKDFWDLHELLNKYSINEMVNLHRQRFLWTHDEPTIMKNFTNFKNADDDFDPICLNGKEWAFIKEDIEEAVENKDTTLNL